jgi:hypothetical protein
MNPISLISLCTEIFIIGINTFCLIYFSIFLFFNVNLEYTNFIIKINEIAFITFILDILKSFYTGYY